MTNLEKVANDMARVKRSIKRNATTKQERIERVIEEHGHKKLTVKQLANYANVSPKTFRTRCSKMKAKNAIFYHNSWHVERHGHVKAIA